MRESEAIRDEAIRLMHEYRLVEQLRVSGHVSSDSSFHLYEAVLLGGAREPEEVHAWLDRNAGS